MTNSSTAEVISKPKTDIANDTVIMLLLFSVNLFMAVTPLVNDSKGYSGLAALKFDDTTMV